MQVHSVDAVVCPLCEQDVYLTVLACPKVEHVV